MADAAGLSLRDLLSQLGLKTENGSEWTRDMSGFFIHLQATEGPGTPIGRTWWLTVVGEASGLLEFQGTLGACLMQYAAVAGAIGAGVFCAVWPG